MSPFLNIQPSNDFLYFAPRFRKPSFQLTKLPVESLTRVATVEEAEDHYIDSAPRLGPCHDELTTFAINAQASVQAKFNRRGIGRIVLLHPVIFERIRNFPNGGTQFVPEYREMGRWRLVATEPFDRGLEIWLADHLSQDEIITVFKPVNRNSFDGMAIMQLENGFALGPADDYYELSLIHCRKVI